MQTCIGVDIAHGTGVGKRFLLLVIAILIVSNHVMQAQFTPIGNFTYILSNGQDFNVTGADATIQDFETQQVLSGFQRQNTLLAVNGIYAAVQGPFAQARILLSQVQAAQQRSDATRAAAAAAQANAEIAEINKYVSAVGTAAAWGDVQNRDFVGLGSYFFQYATDLVQSIKNAQSVAAQIQTFIKNNEAGIRLWNAAQGLEGAVYKPGMQCSDLIIAACRAPGVGVNITTTPAAGTTMTNTWFNHGMGPEFLQILGGASGETLDQLAQDEGSGKVAIPIGAVIVADGHAALFDGVVKVGNQWQIITYDANNATGWTVSLSGVPSTADPQDTMVSFPGHQVGIHVTRLQWGSDHLVKVFQPIGNHLVFVGLSTVSVPPGSGLSEEGQVPTLTLKLCNPPGGTSPVAGRPTCIPK